MKWYRVVGTPTHVRSDINRTNQNAYQCDRPGEYSLFVFPIRGYKTIFPNDQIPEKFSKRHEQTLNQKYGYRSGREVDNRFGLYTCKFCETNEFCLAATRMLRGGIFCTLFTEFYDFFFQKTPCCVTFSSEFRKLHVQHPKTANLVRITWPGWPIRLRKMPGGGRNCEFYQRGHVLEKARTNRMDSFAWCKKEHRVLLIAGAHTIVNQPDNLAPVKGHGIVQLLRSLLFEETFMFRYHSSVISD